MIGHGVGLVAAVFNFDRRSAAFNDILLKFGLMGYFDHHYGLRPATIIDEDLEIAKEITTLLRSDLSIHKCQAGKCVESLGITYSFDSHGVLLKSSTRLEQKAAIDHVPIPGKQLPAEAGKTQGLARVCLGAFLGTLHSGLSPFSLRTTILLRSEGRLGARTHCCTQVLEVVTQLHWTNTGNC